MGYLTNLTSLTSWAIVLVMTTGLSEKTFSSAKSSLSSVMDEVVHQHRPHLVLRHGQKEQMLLVRPEDARRWLDTFRFSLTVTLDEGQVAVFADCVNTFGVGESFDDALDDLVVALRDYAHRFFVERPNFYAETKAAEHAPWLLRFALTPPDEQRALLDADLRASASAASAV